MNDPIKLIKRLYEVDNHRDSKEDNAISVTTLIGDLYKAKLSLRKSPRDQSLIDFKFKRSSTLGTAFHEYAEKYLRDDNIVQEVYREKQIEISGIVYTISGCCDLLQQQDDGTWDIMDWKTFYGRERKSDALAKDAMQMSLYRWLLQDEYDINDRGWVLAISQSNNFQEAYPVNLSDLDTVQDYIDNKIFAIEENDKVDCFNVKYPPCNYCSFICEHRK